MFRTDWSGGYMGSSLQDLDFPPNCLVSGSQNLLYTAAGRIASYKGTDAITSALTDSPTLMFNVNDGYGILGGGTKGSLFTTISSALISVGSGVVYYNGVSLAFSASSTPQITLFSSGAYGTTYQIGLAQPSAPTIAARTPDAGFTGKNSGTYGVKITRVRSATGAESIGSPVSNAVSADKQSFRITFPAAATGQDRWGVYVSQAGFPSGPFYFLQEVTETAVAAGTIDSIARSNQFEWSDGDVLTTLAPIDNYPPPAGIFGAAVNDTVCIIGCYGDTVSGVSVGTPGTAIAVSLPLFPEAFPPDNLLFLPGPPTAVLSRPTDGYAYVAGKDYLCALTYTGGTPALTLQEVWPNTGVQYQHNICIVDGRVFAFIGGTGLVMMSGDEVPDSKFSAPVSADIASWSPATTVVGYDAGQQQVCVMNGTSIFAYSLQSGQWSALLTAAAPSLITSALTVARNLYIGGTGSASYKIFQFNNSSTGTQYIAQTPFFDAGSLQGKSVNGLEVAARFGTAGDAITVDLLGGRGAMSTTSKRKWTLTAPVSGAQHFNHLKPNVRNCKSLAVKVTSTNNSVSGGPIALEVHGEGEGVPT